MKFMQWSLREGGCSSGVWHNNPLETLVSKASRSENLIDFQVEVFMDFCRIELN